MTAAFAPPAVILIDDDTLILQWCAVAPRDPTRTEPRTGAMPPLQHLHRFDLAILDHQPPAAPNGAGAGLPAVPGGGIVHLSAYADDATIRRAATSGALRNVDAGLGDSGPLAATLREAIATDDGRTRVASAAARRATRRERQRIGAELHDGLAQELAGIAMLAAAIEHDAKRDAKGLSVQVAELRRLLGRAQEHCRTLSHSRVEPAVPGSALGRELRALAVHEGAVSGIECRYVGPLRPGRAIADRVSHNLYRIAQEALGNAVRHSRATRIIVHLDLERDGVTLSVRDNGIGLGTARDAEHGIGTRTMRYRAHSVGGSFSIHDVEPAGVEVLVRIPTTPRRRSRRRVDGA